MKLIPFLILFISCQKPAPTNLGINSDQKFSPCESTSNCVTSFEYNDGTYLAPIESQEDPARIYKKIVGIVEKDSTAKIIEQRPDYLYVQYSGTLGMIDDTEFWFGESENVHFKSQGRIDFSDLGSNKKRIEMIRFKFHQNDF